MAVIVSTFNPEKIPYRKHALMFKKLFECLKQHILILPALDMQNVKKSIEIYKEHIARADMIFHYTGMLIAQFPYSESYEQWLGEMMRARGFCWSHQYMLNKKEQHCIEEINTSICQANALLYADVFFKTEEELYALLGNAGLSVIRRFQKQEYENNKFFPVIIKYANTTKAQGVYYTENERQLNILNSSKCVYLRFIESPSEYYTHYRIYTAGSSIIAAVLCYSGAKKKDAIRIIDKNNAYDNPESSLFLNRKLIASNRTYGGKVIPLNLTQESQKITDKEKHILTAHHIVDQKLPAELAAYAKKTAEIASKNGLYLIGQDWIQDTENRFHCIEINWGPELTSIDAVYNKGKGEDDTTRAIAAEKIAEAIISDMGI
jgi:hypothetical protein